MNELLRVEGLSVSFPADGGTVQVVRDVSLSVGRGEVVGLVGESGCGKTLTALSLLRLVPAPGHITAGRILLDGDDLLQWSEERVRRARGKRVALIFQEPGAALNPVFPVGFQVAEAARIHRRLSRREARREARRLLELVAIPDAARRLDDYPHQLSGGQRQRVLIAAALSGEPDLLIADEPTTALDVTIQAQILELLDELRRRLGLAVLLITHDLAVVAETCDRALVMYAGEVVEEGPVDRVFSQPAHPYTRALLAVLPRLEEGTGQGPLPSVPGQVPDAARRPSGCPFHPRCPEVMAACSVYQPAVYRVGQEQRARCFLYGAPQERQEAS